MLNILMITGISSLWTRYTPRSPKLSCLNEHNSPYVDMTIHNRAICKTRRVDRPQTGCGVMKGRNPCCEAHIGWNPERVTEQHGSLSPRRGLAGRYVHSRGFVHCVHSTPCLWSVSPSDFDATITAYHLSLGDTGFYLLLSSISLYLPLSPSISLYLPLSP